MNEIWNIVEPYIVSFLKMILEGTSIVLIIRLLVKRLMNRASALYDVNTIANKVADKLGGKTINVDVAALADKRFREAIEPVKTQMIQVVNEFKLIKNAICQIGIALTCLKALPSDNRAALVAAVKELDESIAPIERDIIATVKLEPLPSPSSYKPIEPTAEPVTADDSLVVNME